MRRNNFLFILLLTSSISLSSCNKKIGKAYQFPKEYNEEDLRLVSEEDYIVDFSKGDSDRFTVANGYSNSPHGGPFEKCIWSRNSVSIENGLLNLSVQEKDGKYYGAEYRSKRNEFSYGYYATKMKPAKCSGVISSFFTYTNYPWDEIDIEFIGSDTTSVQFNHFYDGESGHGYVYRLGFDASLDFHEYGFDWQPNSLTYYIDGFKVYETNIEIPTHNQQIMMNCWNCYGMDNWSGTFDPSKLPVHAEYKFIAYIPSNN